MSRVSSGSIYRFEISVFSLAERKQSRSQIISLAVPDPVVFAFSHKQSLVTNL